ncbi:MAG: glycosyl hydrolase family 8 [Candidatus Saganbacteria bacterium]|nr:glycosyl hydrolase family 8 [Candidatus Saganbacteria bacterium]
MASVDAAKRITVQPPKARPITSGFSVGRGMLSVFLFVLLLVIGGGCKKEKPEQSPRPAEEKTLRITPKLQQLSEQIMLGCGYKTTTLGGVDRGVSMHPNKKAGGTSPLPIPPAGSDLNSDGFAAPEEILLYFALSPEEFPLTSLPDVTERKHRTAKEIPLTGPAKKAVEQAQNMVGERLKAGEVPLSALPHPNQSILGKQDKDGDEWVAMSGKPKIEIANPEALALYVKAQIFEKTGGKKSPEAVTAAALKTEPATAKAGPAVASDVQAPSIKLSFPNVHLGNKALWGQRLSTFWETCYAGEGGYLVSFLDSKERKGLVVKDPSQDGLIVSEATGYGMIISSGTDMVSRSNLHQKYFDQLFVGYQAMEVLGGGLPAWKVVVEGNRLRLAKDAGSGNTASDALEDVFFALTIADQLVQKGIWKKGEIDYAAERARIRQQLIDKLIITANGRLILAPLAQYCDEGGSVNVCKAFLFNPSYVKVLYYLLDGDPKLKQLAQDSLALLMAHAGYGLIPDWSRVEVLDSKEFSIGPSAQSNKPSSQGFDAIRWPISILGGGAEAGKMAREELRGRSPQKLLDNFEGTGQPPEITLSMGLLLAFSSGDQALVTAYEQALAATYKEQGYFSDIKGRYYNNSLAALAVILTSFPDFWQQPVK